MKGWKYEWVDELPIEVYEVLIEEMTKPRPELPED